MFSIIGVPSHFANGVVRWLHYLGGPQLTKVDHGSSGKVFPFPSVFTDLNSIPPYCTLSPYLGVGTSVLRTSVPLLEVRTGGDRQIQIGGQAGTNLKSRIDGDNPIALLKFENSIWLETHYLWLNTQPHLYHLLWLPLLWLRSPISYSPWTLLLLLLFYSIMYSTYSVQKTPFTGYLLPTVCWFKCSPRFVSSCVKGYPFPPGKERIGRFEIHDN